MTRRSIVISATVAAAVLAGLAVLALVLEKDRTITKSDAPLELTKREQLGPRLQELTFETGALGGPTGVRVLLPDGYEDSKTRYPVLYLLHGGDATYKNWTEGGEAESITAGQPLIVVMPDGGAEGFYSDWYNHGEGGQPEWEKYHVGQLIPWVDKHYRTIASKQGRAVAGPSMGGFGAMSYAARHPGLFTAAASFSGAVDITYEPWISILEGEAEAAVGEPAIWGSFDETPEVWREHNPVDQAAKLRGTKVYLFTGNGQPGGKFGDPGDDIEPAIEQMNLALAGKLEELKIPHQLDDYGPGGHNTLYVIDDFRRVLPSLMKDLSPPQ